MPTMLPILMLMLEFPLDPALVLTPSPRVLMLQPRDRSWLSLPPLRKGRRGHVMTVTKGKLMVAGGEGVGRRGKEYLDDMEIFTGKRWVPSKQKLDRPRSNFSLVKIPDKKTKSLQKKPRRSQVKKKLKPKKEGPKV